MKKIVVSAINFSDGGPLSVMRDCLKYLSKNLTKEYEIIALVHDKQLYEDIQKITYIEFKDSKKSYLKRFYYEYVYFKKLSRKIKPYLWLSMHDITPNVEANIRAVYCHNPMPFYKMSKLEIKMEPKLFLFNIFYKYIYKINIKKNNYVIVQQNWIKKEFEKTFKINNVILSHPIIDKNEINYVKKIKSKDKLTFFYPAISRVFKNFEVICEAAKSLEEKNIENLEFVITLDKGINKYGDYIYNKYKNIKSIKFLGKISREEVFSYYDYADVLIFPSKLETWGLPISEFKEFKKKMIISDFSYAKETVGTYENVNFFNPNSSKELEANILKIIKNERMDGNIEKKYEEYSGWDNLFKKIIN